MCLNCDYFHSIDGNQDRPVLKLVRVRTRVTRFYTDVVHTLYCASGRSNRIASILHACMELATHVSTRSAMRAMQLFQRVETGNQIDEHTHTHTQFRVSAPPRELVSAIRQKCSVCVCAEIKQYSVYTHTPSCDRVRSMRPRTKPDCCNMQPRAELGSSSSGLCQMFWRPSVRSRRCIPFGLQCARERISRHTRYARGFYACICCLQTCGARVLHSLLQCIALRCVFHSARELMKIQNKEPRRERAITLIISVKLKYCLFQTTIHALCIHI